MITKPFPLKKYSNNKGKLQVEKNHLEMQMVHLHKMENFKSNGARQGICMSAFSDAGCCIHIKPSSISPHCQQNVTCHYEKLMNMIIASDYGFAIIPEILDIVHHSTLKAHNSSHILSASFKFHSLGSREKPMQVGHLQRATLNPCLKTKNASHVQNFSHDFDCIPLFFIGQ
jgi:hypothetical protein